jgi:hypothetical protein
MDQTAKMGQKVKTVILENSESLAIPGKQVKMVIMVTLAQLDILE